MDPWEVTLRKTTASIASGIIKISKQGNITKVQPGAYFLKDSSLIALPKDVTSRLATDTENAAMEIHLNIKNLDPDYLVLVLPMLMVRDGNPQSVIVMGLESADRQIFMFFSLNDLFKTLESETPELVWKVMGEIDKKNDTKTSVPGPLLDIYGTGNILALPPVPDIKGQILAHATIV